MIKGGKREKQTKRNNRSCWETKKKRNWHMQERKFGTMEKLRGKNGITALLGLI